MKRRGGKREGAGQKKSPALTKLTREMNKKHWRGNHHYIYIWKIEFSQPGERFVRGESFVNDSNFASRRLGLEQSDEDKLRYTVGYLLERTTSSRTLFSTGRASAFAMIWIWFLNLDSGEVFFFFFLVYLFIYLFACNTTVLTLLHYLNTTVLTILQYLQNYITYNTTVLTLLHSLQY